MSLPWIQTKMTAKAYPYEITHGVRDFQVWIYDSHGLTCLARDLPTMSQAKGFCEIHNAQNREIA